MTSTFEDAFNLLCGKQLGAGIHRKVFACRIRDDLVVKVEDDANEWRNFANVREMQFWCDWEHHEPVAKWLAPCDYLSPDGRIMLQRRCDVVPESYEMPSELPGFLTDLKRENFGLIAGRLVCVDFAGTIPAANKRMRKAVW